MDSDFSTVMPLLLNDEGGYCNDAGDPGGPTKYGIIYDDLVQWRGLPKNALMRDRIDAVHSVTVDEALAIYKAKYWDALHCTELPSGVDYAVFDYGVNSGIGRAAKTLQRIAGVNADGVIGGMTLNAVSRMDPAKVVDAICDQRLSFLEGLGTWWRFGKGWRARVVHVHSDALQLIRKSVTQPVDTPTAAPVVAANATPPPAVNVANLAPSLPMIAQLPMVEA